MKFFPQPGSKLFLGNKESRDIHFWLQVHALHADGTLHGKDLVGNGVVVYDIHRGECWRAEAPDDRIKTGVVWQAAVPSWLQHDSKLAFDWVQKHLDRAAALREQVVHVTPRHRQGM